VTETRDIDGDYREARIQAYHAYLRAGRTDRAEAVAAVLRERHGYEVEPTKKEKPVKTDDSDEPPAPGPAPERADLGPTPENTAEPAPEPPAKPSSEPSPQDVRAWAAEQGIKVPARGRLSDEVVQAYLRAHQDG
jgi:Lsr2